MLTKLELVTRELENRNAFDGTVNDTAKLMTELLGEKVPFTMALAIANYTMSTFVGHFHTKIELDTNNLIPMNCIIFILAKSGARKTSSMLKLEKSLHLGYEVIDSFRRQKAEEYAKEFECDMPRINPLSNALATEAGMIKRLNDFKNEGVGCPSLYVDEISTELSSNPDMIPNIKLVAQLFDVGDMKSKPLKDSKMQSEEVHGMGMSALFIGSEHGILEDETVLRKFETEFISKLSRRSMFVYPTFNKEDEEPSNIEDLLNDVRKLRDAGNDINLELNTTAHRIAESLIYNDQNNIRLSEECEELYTLYSIYCEEITPDDVEAVALEQQHRHWKALKLAGVYSIFNGHGMIEISDLKEAIYVVELTARDLGMFIEKANRQPYEVLLDHYQSGGLPLTVHDMVKKRWITRPAQIKDMLILANSKSGNGGMFTKGDSEEIKYTSFTKEDGIGVSYVKTSSIDEMLNSGISAKDAKGKLGQQVTAGYVNKVTTFEKLSWIMTNDVAYTPFKFREGIRGKDYIEGGADFIVLDVDDSDITFKECSDLLSDYRHIIGLTSQSNPFKFRVILPTDVKVDIENDKWKPFIARVSAHLGIKVDLLPKSQVYFGYKGRETIVYDAGLNLEASELMKNIDAVSPKVKQLKSNEQVNDAWEDRINEFSNAYNATSGKGLHNNLWYATAKAHDLGFNLRMGIELLDDIVDYIEDKPRDGYVTSLKRRMITDTSTYPNWVAEAKDLSGMD